ncbi:MAG: HEAT repeat domain-containing protein [Gallionella sp.]
MTNHPENTPYLGLRPFTEAEKDKFFGRDEEIHILTDKILAHRLTLLVAASGVGKSSLLQAGVMPQLRASGMADLIYHNDWAIDPARDLKHSIVKHFIQQQRVTADYAPDLDQPLNEFLQTHALLGIGTVVILLDQFEEFFYYQKFSSQRDQFIQQLAAALHDSDTPTAFVFSMREDFAMEMEAFKPFFKGIFDNIYRIEKLELPAARAAILKPIAAIGYHYQPALLEQLLADLGRRERNERLDLQHADQAALTEARVEPPHLQIVCQQLWQHAHASATKEIGLDHYQQLDKAEGILSSYFKDKMGLLNRAQQRLASRAFDLLVSQHGAKMAYPLDELAKLLRENPDSLKISLDQLQTAAILRRIQRQGKPWYELYHDIFAKSITEWNQAYKKKQLREQLLKRGGVISAVLLSILLAFDGWENHQQRHFRLGQETVSERVEVYQGKLGSWDIFGQSQFLYESDFERKDIEADKRVAMEGMAQRDNSVEMQIGELPLYKRFVNYAQAGLFDSADKVFEALLKARENVNGLDSIRARTSVEHLRALMGINIGDAFSQFGRIRGQATLLEQLTNKNANVRSNAAWALGDLKDAKAIPKLITLLADNDRNVRGNAVMALGKLKAEAAIPKLIILLADNDGKVRSSAAAALGNLKAEAAIPKLITLLADDYVYVRSSAAEALGKLNAHEAIPKLITLLVDNNVYVRSSAAEALGKLNAHEAIPKLITLLTDYDSNIRLKAALALANLNANAPIPTLIALLEDNNSTVAYSAAQALGNFRVNLAIPKLIALCARFNNFQCPDVMTALGKLPTDATIPKLIALLSDNDIFTRIGAAIALGNLKHPAATPKLITLLNDNNWNVRYQAAMALGELRAYEATPKLITLLGDARVAFALGKLKAVEAIPKLITLLADNDNNVRLSAARALDELHVQLSKDFQPNKQTSTQEINTQAPILDNLRADATNTQQNPYLRFVAVDALGKMGGDAAGKVLLPLLADPQLHLNVAYWLAQLSYRPAQSALQGRFDTLVQQKAAWRAARDAGKFARSDKEEELTVQKDNSWQDDYQLYQYAYALARIAPEKDGMALLSHPLYQVRQAAVQALAEKANGALLQHVLAAHQAFNAKDLPSPFPTTAYRALDKMLYQLEFNGTKADLALLKTLKAKNFPAQPKQKRALNERFDWTIAELEYRLGKK